MLGHPFRIDHWKLCKTPLSGDITMTSFPVCKISESHYLGNSMNVIISETVNDRRTFSMERNY